MVDPEKTKKDFINAYELYSDVLFKHCYFRVSSRETALDLTQDVFTKTWEFLSKGNEVENIKAFLFKVLGNSIIDHYRKHKSQSLDSMLEEGAQFVSDQKESEKTEIDIVMKAIDKLPDNYKEVVFMRYVDDLSPQEIAQVIGENENVVSVRIHRGLEKLKEILHIDL